MEENDDIKQMSDPAIFIEQARIRNIIARTRPDELPSPVRRRYEALKNEVYIRTHEPLHA